MTERALVKPPTEIMPESSWSTWTAAHLNYYTDYYGYTLIEDYEPPAPPEE